MSVTYDKTDAVGWITLERPAKLNALTLEMWQGLARILDEVTADDEVRCVVVHGRGRSFCAGADVAGFEGGNEAVARLLKTATATLQQLGELPIPSIAAVHGFVLGAGCEMSMVCDLVVADQTARFGLPEVGVGALPSVGLLRGLDHISRHVLNHMVFAGEQLDARSAKAAGLVNLVVPVGEHIIAAAELTTRIRSRSAPAVRAAKHLLSRTNRVGADEAFDAALRLASSGEGARGARAFRGRRTTDSDDHGFERV